MIIPAWAEKELGAKQHVDAEELHELRSYASELMLLRYFYESWEALHKIPRDKLHRTQQEEAAQRLVGSAHTIRVFRSGRSGLMPNTGDSNG